MPDRVDDLAVLLDGVTERTALGADHGKSGARLERVIIGGQPYVLKHLDLGDDWTMPLSARRRWTGCPVTTGGAGLSRPRRGRSGR